MKRFPPPLTALLLSMSLLMTACHSWHGPTFLSEKVETYINLNDRDQRLHLVPAISVKRLVAHLSQGTPTEQGQFELLAPDSTPMAGSYVRTGDGYVLSASAGQTALRLSVQKDSTLRDEVGNTWQLWTVDYR
jgi:hypothetical protein